MNEESIRQDKDLARSALNGLTAYAEQIVHQGKDDEIQQVRSLVDAISGYWGVDEKRDWTGEFDERVQKTREQKTTPRLPSSTRQMRAVMGLFRYAEEMSTAQGVDEIERILEIPDVIRRLGEAWEMNQCAIENYCGRIENIAESLQAAQQTMGMGLTQ